MQEKTHDFIINFKKITLLKEYQIITIELNHLLISIFGLVSFKKFITFECLR
jgi:hypothetical protein